jgi:MFS family permease
MKIKKDIQIIKFAAYGFFKNLRFFDPFIILFFKEQGILYFQIGILYGFREILTAILEIPTGFVADSWGRKYSLMLSFVSYIISFLIFFFFPYFYIYFIAMLFYSLGDSLRSGTHKAMIMSYLKIKELSHLKVHYYGFTRSWSRRGSAISAILAGLMVFFSGSYKYVFVASIIPYLIDFLLIMSYPQYLNKPSNEKTNNVSLKIKFANTVKEFLLIFKNKKVLDVFFNSSVFDGTFKSVKDYIQPIIKSYALVIPIVILEKEKQSVIILSLIYFVLYMLSAYSSQYSYLLKSKFQKSSTALNISYLLGVFSVALIGIFFVSNIKLLAIIFFILLYILQNMRRPIAVEIISERVKSGILASGLSAESLLKMLITVITSVVFGFFM